MKHEWGDPRLKRLYNQRANTEKYPPEIVQAFEKVVQAIRAAKDEQDLRALKSLRYEKLKGRSAHHSLRLNEQWRLIVSRRKTDEGIALRILEVTNHYD